MKTIFYSLSLLLMIIIPSIIFFANYDAFAITSAEHLKDKLDIFLTNYRYGIVDEGINWLFVSKVLVAVLIAVKLVDGNYMANRLSGLNLAQRKADWILNIWFIIKVSCIWFTVYLLANYLGINTELLIESVNVAFYCVMAGIFFRVLSTYKHFMYNIKG